MEGGGGVGGREASLVGGPEPSVDALGEEVGAVATVKVAETARGPDVFHACQNQVERKIRKRQRETVQLFVVVSSG